MGEYDSLIEEAAKANGVEEVAEEVTPTESVAVEETPSEAAAPATETSTEGATENEKAEVKVGESEQKAEVSKVDSKVTEPRPKRNYHRSEDPLARARYSAIKYKQKYNSAMRDYEERISSLEKALNDKQVELDKYAQLDPSKIEDDTERSRFITWQEVNNQRADDMARELESLKRRGSDELNAIRRQAYEEQRYMERMADKEAFDDKVSAIYGDNEERFRELDDEWGDVYEQACDRYDRDNVIRDFMRTSDVAPAIKNIIYEDPQLQEALFVNVNRNPAIAANQRIGILKNVERAVYNWLQNGNKTSTAQEVGQTAPSPVKRTGLKHITVTPKADIAVPAKPAPKATGSFVKGTDMDGTPDARSLADSEFMRLFGGQR